MQIIHYENTVISFSGMATLNKPGVNMTPSPSVTVPAQSCSWERREWTLEGKATCISGRVTRLMEELNSPRFGNWTAFVSSKRIYLFPEHDSSVPLFTVFILHSWELYWLDQSRTRRKKAFFYFKLQAFSLSVCLSLKDGYKLFG